MVLRSLPSGAARLKTLNALGPAPRLVPFRLADLDRVLQFFDAFGIPCVAERRDTDPMYVAAGASEFGSRAVVSNPRDHGIGVAHDLVAGAASAAAADAAAAERQRPADGTWVVMGVVLIIGLLAGIIGGTAVSVALVVAMVLLTRRQAARRTHVWRTFGGSMAVFVALGWVAVRAYPLPTVRPGSDYDVALENLLVSGFAYSAAPGLAAVLAFLVTLSLPRAPTPPAPPESG